jgi:hypothetical protein
MASTTAASAGRDVLDAPPRHGRLRNKPQSALGSLAGRGDRTASSTAPITPSDSDDSDSDLINSPDGEMGEIDPSESSELDLHPVVQMFDHYAQARGHLAIVNTLADGQLAPVQDLLVLLDQMIPQLGAAMLSGGALGLGGPGMAGTSPLAAGSGGPPMMGLQQLAGGGVGGPPPMGMVPPPPGAMM